MKHYSFLIKPASSLCNLRCKYCFYCDVANVRDNYSFGVMNQATMTNLIKESFANNPTHLTYAFQGGEPTLAGLDYFINFTIQVNQLKNESQVVQYAIQTNGYNLDEQWINFFKENNFLVGISLDGYQENHDKNRLNQTDTGTFSKIMDNIKLLKEKKVDFNILTVLTKDLAKHPEKLYQFYKKNEFNFIQLIPCLPQLNKNPQDDPYALTPQLFASFYNKLYSLWYKDYLKNKYISITLFDNLIPIFSGIAPSQCGMLGFCQPQYVVESDGSIYPCDFYAIDQYLLGNINNNSIHQLAKSKILTNFINEPKRESIKCKNCKFKKICKGNCKRLNISYFDDKGYCGYQDFLENNYQSMAIIAQKIKAT